MMVNQSKVITVEDGIETDGLQSSLEDEIGMASYAFAQNDVEESKGRDDPQMSDLSCAGSCRENFQASNSIRLDALVCSKQPVMRYLVLKGDQ